MEVDNNQRVGLDKEVTRLCEENAYLKKILALTPGNVYWKDRQGRYLGCNNNMAKLVKLASPEEVVGKSDLELIGARGATVFTKVDREVMECNEERFLEEYGNDVNGEPATYLTRKIPLHDEEGNVIGVLGVSFDITERKKMEEELRISREDAKEEELLSLKEIIALLPGNIYWKDRKGVYQGCNNNMASIYGLSSRHEVLGKIDEDVMGAELAAPVYQLDNEVMDNDMEVSREEVGYDVNKDPAIYLTRKIPLHNRAGKVIGLLGLSFDITERKRMEEELLYAKEKAEAANRAKTEFLAVASHELRIPLTGILGLANFLNEGNLSTKEEKEYIKLILESGKHLLAIINDVLDFAKLEAEKFELAPTSLNLKELIEEVVAMLTAPAKNKGLDLLVSYESDIPHTIQGDSRALRQMLVNLVGNAIKFTQHGHVAIKVHNLERSHYTVRLQLIVEDTGIGIPADKLETIFERFEQVDSSYTRKQGGTGLGLSITKKLVELMGGNIYVTSELGKGSAFHITIEFHLQDQEAIELPWESYAAKVRVLVIDDTPRGAVICKHIGCSNCETISGDKALHTIMSAQQLGEPYDVVIVDQQLRTNEPVELLRAIRVQKNLQKPMPLLLVSSGSLKEKHIANAEGFFDVVVKPVQPIAFQTILTSAWERWIELSEKKKPLALKILLVEDDKVVQLVHKRMLTSFGCDVIIAKNGKEALEMWADGHDVIFVDVGLPDISGFEVIKNIRQQENGPHKIPIIALTGYTGESEKQACLEAGANEVATKPIEPQDLQDILSRYGT